MQSPPPRASRLVAIKLLHTAIWIFFVACIVAIPVAAAYHRFRWVAVFTGVVLLECGILLVNQGRCPLTNVAYRYTEERSDSADIYLPSWLARYNKPIFGTLFVLGELFALYRWLAS